MVTTVMMININIAGVWSFPPLHLRSPICNDATAQGYGEDEVRSGIQYALCLIKDNYISYSVCYKDHNELDELKLPVDMCYKF